MRAPGGSGLPGWATLLLSALLPARERDAWLGDLEERFRRIDRTHGGTAARRWILGQVVRSVGPALAMRWRARGDASETNAGGMNMDRILTDLRLAFRSLRKSPAFTAIAVLTLAMAMAVNTAIFSIVSGIFVAELPLGEPERTAFIWGRDDATARTLLPVSRATYLDLSADLSGVESTAALEQTSRVLTGRGDPVRVSAAAITPDFLDIWGVDVARGRDLVDDDVAPGASDVVLLSHGFWTRSMGRDPEAVGSALVLDGRPHTVVGIVPAEMEFGGLAGTELWVPLRMSAGTASRLDRTLMVTARLAPGATVDQLRAEVAGRWDALSAAHPEETRNWTVEARSTRESLVNESARTVMLLLTVIVGVVLLIACANVANMLLARGARRSRELAVRAALGAGRAAILRPLLTESLILSVTATASGLALSAILLDTLADLTRDVDAIFTMASIDLQVLGFSAGLALLAPLVFGGLPALRASRTDPSRELGERSAGSAGRLGRIRSILVGAQVALAMVALVVGGLLVRSGIELQRLGADYRQEGIVTASLLRPGIVDAPDDDFFARFVDEAAEVPGVEAVALVSELPRRSASVRPVEVEGRPPLDEGRRAYESVATPGYLELLEIPLLRGRAFSTVDGREAVPVAVISQAMAETFWPDAEAVGRRFRIGGVESPWLEVVGVAADVKRQQSVASAIPHYYRPLAQAPVPALTMVARSARSPEAIREAIRSAAWAVDPDQPVDAVVSLRVAEFQDMAVSWAIFGLFVLFALFALLMAAAGIYGVVSYSVASRTPEFGIRLALGAPVGRVRSMVLRQGLGVVLAGTVVGLGGAWLAAGMMGGMVVGIRTRDPLTFAVVPALVVAVALAANWVPAIRATRVSPVAALRDE